MSTPAIAVLLAFLLYVRLVKGGTGSPIDWCIEELLCDKRTLTFDKSVECREFTDYLHCVEQYGSRCIPAATRIKKRMSQLDCSGSGNPVFSPLTLLLGVAVFGLF